MLVLVKYKFGFGNTCRLLLYFVNDFASLARIGDDRSKVIFKHEFELKMVLELNRNKRGSKRFSFGLVEII